jgi:hypothetical protein
MRAACCGFNTGQLYKATFTGQIMTKFSTAALLLALASASTSYAASDLEIATTAKTPRCAFLPNAPDQHLVVRSDTLWDISGKFLEKAWCWPQVWGLNRDQIRDPHWIYPGQIVYFDRVAGRLRLGNRLAGAADGIPTVKLTAQVRTEGLGQDAIPAIPAGIIEPFLSQPLIIEETELKDAPRIVAAAESRVIIGKSDKAYVRGDLKDGTSFQVFRPGTPVKDPGTQQVIGYEAAYLGTIKLKRAARADNEAHLFTVTDGKEEMGVGDRLLPVPPAPIINYVPHPPEKQVEARIASVYGGVSQAGQNQIVTINRGKNHGVDLGTVLELSRFGETIADRTDGKKPVKLPDEQYGSLFVFRVFNNISYGLVMQVTDSVKVGDTAKSPE